MSIPETAELDNDQIYLASLTEGELSKELDPTNHNNSLDYVNKIIREINNRILEMKALEMRAQGEVTRLDSTYYG